MDELKATVSTADEGLFKLNELISIINKMMITESLKVFSNKVKSYCAYYFYGVCVCIPGCDVPCVTGSHLFILFYW